MQNQGSRESSQHLIVPVVDLGEKDGTGEAHHFPSDHCPQQRGDTGLGTPRAQRKGRSCEQLVPSQHILCLCSFTHHLTSEEATLRERGDQANLSKDISRNESLALRKKPDSALEGEGEQKRGTLLGDGYRRIKRLLLGPCIGDLLLWQQSCESRALGVPTEQLLPMGTWQWELSSSGRLLLGAGDVTHLTQERLGSGGDISHGKCYFLENLGYSGELKAFSTVAPDTLSWLSQKVISNTCKATSEDQSASSPCFPGDSFSCFTSKNQPFVYSFSLFPHGKPFIYSSALPVAFNQVKEVEEEQLFSSRASVPETVLFFLSCS